MAGTGQTMEATREGADGSAVATVPLGPGQQLGAAAWDSGGSRLFAGDGWSTPREACDSKRAGQKTEQRGDDAKLEACEYSTDRQFGDNVGLL